MTKWGVDDFKISFNKLKERSLKQEETEEGRQTATVSKYQPLKMALVSKRKAWNQKEIDKYSDRQHCKIISEKNTLVRNTQGKKLIFS